jgi:hypothetical protein
MSIAASLLLLCSNALAPASPVTDPAAAMPHFGVGHEDDALPAVDTPTVLFINFDGPFMNGGCGNDSRNDCSTLFPNVQFDPYPGDQGMRASVVQAARADVLDFGVVVVGERPTIGDYAMVVVGTPAGGAPANIGGVAPGIDCGNTVPNLTSFAFNVGSGPNGISTVVHQEAAHTWGLEHVDDNSDNLFPTTSGAQDKKYTDECHRVVSNTELDPTFSGCNAIHTMFCEENFQNSYQEMLLLFGPPIADAVPPSVSIEAPTDGQVLQFDEDFELVMILDDDRRPQVLDTAILFDDVEATTALLPDDMHVFPVNGGPSPLGHGLGNGPHTIRVEIVDEAGNPATDEVTFVIEGAPEDVGESSGGDEGSDTDVVPEQTRGEDGCGCTTTTAPWPSLVLLFGLRRRRH